MADIQQTMEEKPDESSTSSDVNTGTVPAQETETDWKAQARKWEERAKSNKARADQLATQLKQLEGASGDLEKALARISALEEHNQVLEHSKLVAEVAAVKKVDAELLTGATREELEAYADRLLAWRSEARQAAAPKLGYQPSKQPKNSDTIQVLRNMFNKE